jgi:hypothetical protein
MLDKKVWSTYTESHSRAQREENKSAQGWWRPLDPRFGIWLLAYAIGFGHFDGASVRA